MDMDILAVVEVWSLEYNLSVLVYGNEYGRYQQIYPVLLYEQF